MHEYSLTQNIIEIAERYAKDAASGKSPNFSIKKIGLVIGEASGISGESVRLYFDIIAQNTVCEGAVLEIETIKPVFKSGDNVSAVTGMEFFVKYIEVDI